jgi:hypothetical protein
MYVSVAMDCGDTDALPKSCRNLLKRQALRQPAQESAKKPITENPDIT